MQCSAVNKGNDLNFQVRLQENVLKGDEYHSYMQRTGRLFPRLRAQSRV